MFASARNGVGGESDDDDWLRVGRSFKGVERPPPAEEDRNERALQVYKRPTNARRLKHSDSDSERESRKRKKKAKKKESKKHRKSRRRSRSRSESESSGDNDRSRSKKRTRRARDSTDQDSDYALARQGSGRDRDVKLTLIKDPAHGELEVYRDSHVDRSGSEKLFEFDCVGDKENVLYGSLYTHEQPLYQPATKRSVIDGEWIAHKTYRVQSQHVSRVEEVQGNGNRYFGPAAKKIEKALGTKRLHLAYSQRRLARLEKAEGTNVKDELSFIPLDAIVDGELDGVEVGDNDRTPQIAEPDSLLWQSDLENIEHFLTAQQKQLNERVNTCPQDVDGWLDLIAFQEQMKRLALTKHRGVAKEDAGILEKQKTICAKAIDKNPHSRLLHRLQLNLLWREQKANDLIIDSDVYRESIERLLDQDRSNADLWMLLIQSTFQKFGSFNMTMLRDLYARTISVLSNELIKSSAENRGEASQRNHGSNPSFIHVVGTNSLLQPIDTYESDALDTKTLELSKSLLEFHFCSVRAELSAGYSERAISHIQALIAFNECARARTRQNWTDRSHPRLIEAFVGIWNAESHRTGEDSAGTEISLFYPSDASFESLVGDKCQELLHQCNPPKLIRSSAHNVDLIGPFVTRNQSKISSNVEDDSYGVDFSEGNPGRQGQWVYSNLHGKRIWVAYADDRQEYEKILDELRGSERYQKRQQSIANKEESRAGKQALIVERLRDERSDYPLVDVVNDQFVQWMVSESRVGMVQWQPLRASNPEHAQLIELQPDRAVLTEEVLPFVFRVPRLLHLRMFINLLEIVGVHISARSDEASRFANILSSDDFEDVPLLTRPILDAFDPTSPSIVALSSGQRYGMIMKKVNQDVGVSSLAAVDRGRVKFIRSIFLEAIKFFDKDLSGATQIIKGVWLEYEAEVIAQTEDKDSALKEFRALSQHLLSSNEIPSSRSVDIWLMSVYAAAEERLGNERVARRTCDKILASLLNSAGEMPTSVCRSFHRLVFLRSQQALKSDHGVLGCQYAFFVMWKVWHPESQDTLESMLRKHRNSLTSLQCLLSDLILQSSIDIVARYRLELHIALDQCSGAANSGVHLLSTRCSVPFALANLCTSVYASEGFEAACEEYEQFLRNIDTAKSCSHQLQCRLMQLAFLQHHQMSQRSPILAPRRWRGVIARGLSHYPLEPLLLRLFVDAETSNTASQSLRKYFQARQRMWRRSQESPEVVEWLFILLCEVSRAERNGVKYLSLGSNPETSDRRTCCVLHRWGKNRPAVERIRRLFEEMVGDVRTSGSAIGWRLYLRFELSVGKVESSRRVFYRALVKCPWSKALYLDGLCLLRPYLNGDECKEILDFLDAKEIHVRVDT